MCDRRIRQLSISTAGAMLVLLAGCADVKYAYYIPDGQSDCPSGTIYRSGGTGIVDRDGGTGIVDRSDKAVSTYCEVQVCPDDSVPTGDPGMVWHRDDHDQILAIGVCPP